MHRQELHAALKLIEDRARHFQRLVTPNNRTVTLGDAFAIIAELAQTVREEIVK